MPHSFFSSQNRTADWGALGKYSMGLYMDEAERVLDDYTSRRDAAAAENTKTRKADAAATKPVEMVEPDPIFLYFAHQEVHIPLQPPANSTLDTVCGAVTAHQVGTTCTTGITSTFQSTGLALLYSKILNKIPLSKYKFVA